MHVVIFEGIHWKTFAPLALSRPVFMLVTGMTSLLDKQVRYTSPTRLTLWVRPEMQRYVHDRVLPRMPVPTKVNEPLDDEPALLFSGRTLHFRPFQVPSEEAVVLDPGDIVRTAFVRNRGGLSPRDVMERSEAWMRIVRLPRIEQQTRMVERLWDLVHWNEESIVSDFAGMPPGQPVPQGPFHLVAPDSLWLGRDVTIQPGAVLNASRGPIVIGDRAVIGANAVIEGPCAIGPMAAIIPQAYIRGGSSIGKMCRIGGEVLCSIIHGASNKPHEGFLGHSYVGKWVNLGAGTVTSNIKNTYGVISLRTPAGDVPTGHRFLGSLIGDHAKTAVGTRLMAGTYIGFASQIATSGIAPRYTPSYTFHSDRGPEPYRVEKAMEVMKTVFNRREREWTQLDEDLCRYVARMAPEAES